MGPWRGRRGGGPRPPLSNQHIPPVVYQASKIESLGVIAAIALECALFASFIAL